MIDAKDTPMTAADLLRRRARVRRYRRRVHNGGASLRIEVGDYHALVDVLLRCRPAAGPA